MRSAGVALMVLAVAALRPAAAGAVGVDPTCVATADSVAGSQAAAAPAASSGGAPPPVATLHVAAPAQASPAGPGGLAGAADPPGPAVLLGPLTRDQVEKAAPSWVTAGVESQPDLAAAHALLVVDPGAEVTVFLGTWCPDSRREVSRLWRALDEIGATAEGGSGGGLPFTLRYIGVDQEKKEPVAQTGPAGLRYVPTFIVRRGGREVGRIVEKSPHGVEVDLLALLNGKASGLLSASPRAASADAAPAPPK